MSNIFQIQLKTGSFNDVNLANNNNSKLVNCAEDILDGADMIDPIQVKKYTKSKIPRYGASGKIYREREYGVWKGNQRVTAAVKLGYTHIEGIIV